MTETCDWDDLVEERGLFYKKFSDVPFTGKATGKVQGELKDGKMDGPWVSYLSVVKSFGTCDPVSNGRIWLI